MRHRFPLVLLSLLIAPAMRAQSVQYRSPAGVEYRSQRDTGAIARAQKALDADPKNVDKIIALRVAQGGVWQFREAIETLTKGLASSPPANPVAGTSVPVGPRVRQGDG
jgi:thioredoxin-like negative regulator of GroEL